MDIKEKGIIDILKLFFSICVIAIHTNLCNLLPSPLNSIVLKCILRLAVPFFFMVTGFFLKQKIEKENNLKMTITNYCKHLLFPYVIFELLSVVLNVIVELVNGYSILYVVADVIRHVLFYPWGALWFIWAAIISALILYFFIRKDKLNIAILVGLFFYALLLLFNNYYFISIKIGIDGIYQVLSKIIVSPRNAFTVGLPLMSIGMKCYDCLKKTKINIKYILLLILLYIAYICEVVIVEKIGNGIDDKGYYILQLPFTAALLLVSASIETSKSLIYKKFRFYSTGFFYIHPIFNTVYSIFISNKKMLFFAVLFSSLVATFIIQNSNNKKLIKLIS